MRPLTHPRRNLLVGVLGLGVAALAAACLPPPAKAAPLVDLAVVNRDTGERLTPIRHGGKLYIAGTPGQRYALELRGGNERVLVVVSVDGVNVLTGQTAAPQQPGYVLDPGRRYAINGWRKSLDDVAQFVFTALPDSYAARTGRPDHVGVIGVAAFREKREPLTHAPHDEIFAPAVGPDVRSGPAAPSPESAAKSAGSGIARQQSLREGDVSGDQPLPKRLGTGHGDREYSPTRSTEFARAGDSPDELLTIYYDSRSNLIARGIIRAPRVSEPRPFPGGFVPDPRG